MTASCISGQRSRTAVRLLCGVVLGLTAAVATAPEAEATPLFARQMDVGCNACHSIVPKLNRNGLTFVDNGYHWPPEARPEGPEPKTSRDTVPFATWITARHEDQSSGGASDSFLPKVELIAGGPIGDALSYFVEWRIVSLSLRGDGSLQDRAGRFEDLFIEWSVADRHSLKFGQFRSLNQVDVSLRLSPSEPLLFRNGLATGTDPDARIESLMRFSPASRSPGIGYSFQSIRGQAPRDGLFHFVTIPFTGELSIPLSSEARETASFELQGPPKGVYLETFYRRGLNTVGVHAFYDDEAWLATGLTALQLERDFFLTAGFGVDDRDGGPSRERYSLELEYLNTRGDRWRPGAGFRVEDVSDDGRDQALVPYLVLSGPNTEYSFLLQLQYRSQDGNDALIVDLSAMF